MHAGQETHPIRIWVPAWDFTRITDLGLGTAPRPELRLGSRSDHPAPGQEPHSDLLI